MKVYINFGGNRTWLIEEHNGELIFFNLRTFQSRCFSEWVSGERRAFKDI